MNKLLNNKKWKELPFPDKTATQTAQQVMAEYQAKKKTGEYIFEDNKWYGQVAEQVAEGGKKSLSDPYKKEPSQYEGQFGQWQMPGDKGTSYSGPWKEGYVPAETPKQKEEDLGYQKEVEETKDQLGVSKEVAFSPETYATEKGFTKYFWKTVNGQKQWYANVNGQWQTVGSKEEARQLTVSPEKVVTGEEPTVPTEPTGEIPITPTGEAKVPGEEGYDITQAQTDLNSASTSKQSAFDNMIGIQTKLYEDEYGKAGMADIKDKIAQADNDIATRKESLNQRLLDERGNPIPQWMITGRLKLEVDAAKTDLDRMIGERNKFADEYNSGIDDITRKVEYGTKDAMTEYAHWSDEEKRLTDLLAGYQKSMTEELERGVETERWEKGFGLEERLMELREEEAARPEALKTSISEYESGGRLIRDTINTQTGEIINREDLGPIEKGGYTPPTSYKEWELSGKPGTFEEWLKKEEPGKGTEDIESYAQAVLRGEKSLTSVSDKIEPQVRARVEELKKTQRIYTDEQIRAQIRNWMIGIEADYGKRSNEEIAEALKGTIELSELTDPDRERFQLILSEIVPSESKKKGGFVEWFKEPFRTVKEDITSWFK